MELVIKEIDKSFDDKVLFKGANFTFEQGKIYGLLGRNGSGKTTLFNCIAQNLPLDAGQIYFQTEAGTRAYTNTEVALALTHPQLPGFMTALEFIKFYLDIHAANIQVHKSPEDWLLQVGIAAADHHRLLKDFSHGMKNKVQLLLPLVYHPPVLLLDEPLTSFDPVAALEFKEMIREAKQSSVIIFSTHILQLAQDLCDEIVLLHHQQLTPLPAHQLHDPDFEQEIVRLLTQED